MRNTTLLHLLALAAKHLLALMLALAIGLSAAHAAAADTDLTSYDLTELASKLESAQSAESSDGEPPRASFDPKAPVKVCAVPQLYAALTTLQGKTHPAFVARFATTNELYALLTNTEQKQLPELCDLVLSSDERLPISLVRSNRALASSLIPFTRAPLVLWSKEPNLLQGHEPRTLMRSGALHSIALAKSSLTPVGFATQQVIAEHLDIGRLKEHTYRADHEYQVYSMVASGNVDCGFISLPLIIDHKQQISGSYWLAPRYMHSDIQYYGVLLTPSVPNTNAQELLRQFVEDEAIQKHLNAYGFAPLKSSI